MGAELVMESPHTPSENRDEIVFTDDLLRRCRQGEDRAWKRLYAACIPLVRRRALRMGFTVAEADDILQETIVTLCKKIEAVDNVPAFVQSVCFRRCVDAIRHRKRWAGQSIDDPDSTSAEFVRFQVESWVTKQKSNDEAAAVLEALSILRDHLASMGAPCGSLLRNRFSNALSYQELAKREAIPEKQVGVYLSRCLKRLKDALQKNEGIWLGLKGLWAGTG